MNSWGILIIAMNIKEICQHNAMQFVNSFLKTWHKGRLIYILERVMHYLYNMHRLCNIKLALIKKWHLHTDKRILLLYSSDIYFNI